MCFGKIIGPSDIGIHEKVAIRQPFGAGTGSATEGHLDDEVGGQFDTQVLGVDEFTVDRSFLHIATTKVLSSIVNPK